MATDEAIIAFVDGHVDEIIEAIEADDYIGLCVYCGAGRYQVEPDACGYPCEDCQRDGAVYGAEELLIYAVP
jgi:prepilin-type processing-associated H-X9-DG protein